MEHSMKVYLLFQELSERNRILAGNRFPDAGSGDGFVYELNESGSLLSRREATDSDRQPSDFYAVEEKELLTATSVTEAVLEEVEDIVDPDEMPITVKVQGYKPMIVPEDYFDSYLDDIYENLSEEFGSPDGDDSEPTEAVKQAWAAAA